MTDLESGAVALTIDEGDNTQDLQINAGTNIKESGVEAPTAQESDDSTGTNELLRSSDMHISNEADTNGKLTRTKIEALGNKVRISDSDTEAGLDLFCYLGLSPSDEGDIVNCRGVVLHGEDIVLHAYPHQTELRASDIDSVREALGEDLTNYRFFDSHEGALIRVFNHSGKWYTSTHRKLDAFRSKWACRESFGTIFKKALSVLMNQELEGVLDRFYETLDTTKQYYFIVSNTDDNRIVCLAPTTPEIFHVGTMSDGVFSLDEDVGVPKSASRTFSSISDLCGCVEDLDARYLQGVIGFNTEKGVNYKIQSSDYVDLADARGNEPSIRFRYLQVRMNEDMRRKLSYLYPKHGEVIDRLENSIYEIAKSIYRSYVQRYIKKRFVSVPKEEFAVIRSCHSWHEENRQSNRITLNKVIEVMNEQSATALNQMVRRYDQDLLKQNEKSETTNIQEKTNTQRTLLPRDARPPSPMRLDIEE